MPAIAKHKKLSFLGRPSRKIPTIIIPICFFILFDCIGLALNYVITYYLDEQAQGINISGRQRMLTQRITKTLYMLNETPSDLAREKAALEELRYSVALFDKTLLAFWQGGNTLTVDGKEIYLSALSIPNIRIILAETLGMWKFVKQNLEPLLMHEQKIQQDQLQTALTTLQRYNLTLLDLMNRQTLELELDAKKQSHNLRVLQSIVFILALINFFIICRRLITNLRNTQKNSEHLEDILNTINTSLILYDRKGKILSTNKATRDLFGYHERDMEKQHISRLILQNHSGSKGIKRDGDTFKARVTCKDITINNRKIFVTTIIDITRQQKKEAKLKQLAFHDPLTGLPNRSLFNERLKQERLHAKRHSTCMAVLFLDLDGFKEVNDRLGHDAGDQLLIQVGDRLKQTCREDDTVSRLGGDEFTIILTAVRSPLSAEHVAKKIIKKINQDYLIYGVKVQIGVSIGISIYPKHHQEEEILMKYADDAMYEAKNTGKNCYVMANP